MTKHRSWIEISEKALRNNIRVLKSLLSVNTRLCAVVRANAYGHGLVV